MIWLVAKSVVIVDQIDISNGRTETMAGYSGYSKSNNAVAAEESGRYPATTLGKLLGVKPKAIKALLTASEWHHTSSHFNRTDYYDAEEAQERLEDLKAWKEPKTGEIVHEKCYGEYTEWSGSRNYPKATIVKFENLTVIEKGNWFTFNLADQTKTVYKIRKSRSTNGFRVYGSDGRRLNGDK
jgi:hypothetical protein